MQAKARKSQTLPGLLAMRALSETEMDTLTCLFRHSPFSKEVVNFD